MNYSFPATKFVEINTVEKQVEHIRSEFVEFIREVRDDRMGLADLEAMDLYHSLETYFRIREAQGVSIGATREWTRKKNENRRYYDRE